MSNYIKAVDFAAKDSLLTGDPLKIVSGTEIDDEYNAIQTAINSKANTNSPALTGSPTAPTATAGTNTTQISTTAFVTTAVTNGLATLGTIATQNADAVAITGGTVDDTVIGGTTPAAITGTTVTATSFVGDVTGNVTGNITGDVTGNADSATTAADAIGNSQTWTDLTGSRSFGTTYTNSTGRSIMVAVTGRGTASNTGNIAAISVDGTVVVNFGSFGSNSRSGAAVVVPDGSTYSASNVADMALFLWTELR